MIRLNRVRTAAAIPAGFRGPRRIARLEELIVAAGTGTFNFRSSVWKSAKNQLKRESAGKCAYCEAPTSAVAHGDVEHFRPKDSYWWLVYCYENYTYACQVCNQSFKNNRFPIAGPAMEHGDLAMPGMLTPDPMNEADGLSYSDFHALCAAERAHLPDVYHDDPELLFKWVASPVLKEVRLTARSAAPESILAAAAAENILGLNRPELKGLRWVVYEDLSIFRDALGRLDPGDTLSGQIRSRIQAMMDTAGEFAGMVRYFVRDEWNLML